MKETSIIILALIALCAALFVYNELSGGEVEDYISTTIAKDTIIEAKIPTTTAAISASAVEKATGVKYVSLENPTTGKVLSSYSVDIPLFAAKTGVVVDVETIANYVIMQDIETGAKVCFELNDDVELTRKGEILKPEAVTEGAYIKVIPV